MIMELVEAEFEVPGWLIARGQFVLDVGGEGRHPAAWNLNRRQERSGAGRSAGPIPRLILARTDAMPLADGTVDLAIVERTPLRAEALRELNRVVKPDGAILLRHAITPAGDPHRVARRYLGGTVARRVFVHRGHRIQETIIRLDRRAVRRFAEHA